MNIVEVHLDESGHLLQHAGFNLPLEPAVENALSSYKGKRLLMGIRPEHIAESGTQDWDGKTPAKGTVEVVETVGHEVIIHVRCGEDLLIAKLGPHRIPRYGDEVEIEMRNKRIHVFDPDTELSLTADLD